MSSVSTDTIVSMAFILMEQTPPSSMSENTQRARDAKRLYPVALNACLEQCDWGFASKVESLPLLATVPEDSDLKYAFQRPQDMVRLISVADKEIEWREDADAIRADVAGPLKVRYTKKIENENAVPALFQQAVAAELAAMLAPSIVKSNRRAVQLKDDAGVAMGKAMSRLSRTASRRRYDGRPRQPDFATEAVR